MIIKRKIEEKERELRERQRGRERERALFIIRAGVCRFRIVVCKYVITSVETVSP